MILVSRTPAPGPGRVWRMKTGTSYRSLETVPFTSSVTALPGTSTSRSLAFIASAESQYVEIRQTPRSALLATAMPRLPSWASTCGLTVSSR